MDESEDAAVGAYLASLDEKTATDGAVLLAMMRRVSGQRPTLWNVGTIGFGTYHYKYDSGREGYGHTIGFYARKGKLTIYLMDGTARHADLLARLGKHSTTGYCVYVARLSEIDLSVLEQLVRASYTFIEAKAKDGPITQILWKTGS